MDAPMIVQRDIIAEIWPETADADSSATPRRRWRWIAGGVALCALLALLGFALYRPSQSASPAASAPVAAANAPPLPVVEDPKLLEVAPAAAQDINAKRPFDIHQVVAARPFVFTGPPDARARALDCLAAVAWYEAGDNAAMEKSVVQVVLNRARHPAFRASICATVFQGSERLTGCQFTFACDGSLRRMPSGAAWERARAVANAALSGAVDPSVGYATHYHADYVVPYWQSSLDKMAKVGAHIFYKWKGYWGTPAAFDRAVGQSEPAYSVLGTLSPAHALPDALPPPLSLILPDTSAETGEEPGVLAPLPTAIAIEGVREKSLRGALVRGQASDSNHFFLQLDPGTFPGNYATAAVALCKGKPSCVVMGWRDATQMASGLPLNDSQRGALTFYFEQRAGVDDKALWNCAQIPRHNAAQCLHNEAPAPIDQARVPPGTKADQ